MPVSRRTFLRCAGALPFAALGAPELFGAASRPRVAVVGAGAFGGWTAFHLRKLGCDVTLVDQWGPGNAKSSSGGTTRVIRSIYGADRVYSEMVKRSFELWESLDAADPERLYVPTGVLWMMRGDDGYVRAALPIVRGLGFPVDALTIDEAKRRYPQIDFRGVKSVYFEHRAGALFARKACGAVRDAFGKAGGRYAIAGVAPGKIANEKMSPLRTDIGGRVDADVYVFACGPWLGKLFPDVIDGAVRPTRQEVYYFEAPTDRFHAGQLPIWIDFGKRIVYGIPGIDGRELKIADDTRGETIDPTTMTRVATPAGVERARAFLAERFPQLAKAPLLWAEVCQYENSPDGNLIVDRHPHAKNVWLLGGGSGHGFKLSPALGEIAANAIVAGKEVPKQFRLDRLPALHKPKTQFEA
ncbi:MAG TPA: FAD-dependent oxidoreductase [Thermoanaerobaculia bacterium]|jgi:glycine/D-amino acid oxidase-like deaminating enzyme